jgi:hypothetical protein
VVAAVVALLVCVLLRLWPDVHNASGAPDPITSSWLTAALCGVLAGSGAGFWRFVRLDEDE